MKINLAKRGQNKRTDIPSHNILEKVGKGGKNDLPPPTREHTSAIFSIGRGVSQIRTIYASGEGSNPKIGF